MGSECGRIHRVFISLMRAHICHIPVITMTTEKVLVPNWKNLVGPCLKTIAGQIIIKKTPQLYDFSLFPPKSKGQLEKGLKMANCRTYF